MNFKKHIFTNFKKLLKFLPMFDPFNKFFFFWDFLMTIIYIFQTMYIPIDIG